ncbi:MAG: cellulase family glycosylhydrolase [Solirubrobacterales bacterium]|nr:cellulase family glycosylhydrolase [Solirubrobacterales bacterium]
MRVPMAALALALAILVSAVPASIARPTAPPVLFGAGGWSFPSEATLDRLADRGLRTWRLTVGWDHASPRPGVMDLSGYDQVLRRARRHRIDVLVTLTGCPAWACPSGGPPKSGAALAGFRRFVRAAVRRWGHHGLRAVTHWQVLNEVNGADQWAPRPSAAGYARLLVRTSRTIRAADRRAKVVVAGLGEKMTVWLRTYLPALYRQRGFRRSFDVMAPEGYTTRPRDVGAILTRTRRIMRRFGDGRKPLFVTEMGWSSGGPPFPFTTSERGQAARLTAAWTRLAACRSRWRLRRVYWFAYTDREAPPSSDYWGFHNGLLDAAGREKPAWQEFVRFLRPARAARTAGRCR